MASQVFACLARMPALWYTVTLAYRAGAARLERFSVTAHPSFLRKQE